MIKKSNVFYHNKLLINYQQLLLTYWLRQEVCPSPSPSQNHVIDNIA